MAYAEPIDGPTRRAGRGRLRRAGVVCVFGMLERDGDRLFNACVLVGPAGLIGSYRKVHLPFLGRGPVRRSRRPPVRGPRGGRPAGSACTSATTGRSRSGPRAEPARCGPARLADELADAFGVRGRAQMACRAMENVVYAMAVNRVGEERGFRFIGRSSIVGHDRRQASPREPGSRRRSSTPRSTRRGPAEAAHPRARPARDRPDRRPPTGVLRPDRRAQRPNIVSHQRTRLPRSPGVRRPPSASAGFKAGQT